jgi:hypothetical protein
MKFYIFAELFTTIDDNKYSLLVAVVHYLSFGMLAEKGIVPVCRFVLFYNLLPYSIS